MGPRRRLSPIGLLTAVIMSGCALKDVGSFAERGFDLSRYRTYSWAAEAAQPTGDPRLDNNQLFRTRVEADIEQGLAGRGFEKTGSDAADLRVRYYASVSQRLEVGRDDRSCAECPAADVYDAGTLIIDLIDARANALVWRGWAEGSIDGAVDDQRWLEDIVGQAIARILERLPRRP